MKEEWVTKLGTSMFLVTALLCADQLAIAQETGTAQKQPNTVQQQPGTGQQQPSTVQQQPGTGQQQPSVAAPQQERRVARRTSRRTSRRHNY